LIVVNKHLKRVKDEYLKLFIQGRTDFTD